MTIDDPKDLVRRGYDALSWHYRRDDADEGTYGPWLAALRERLPADARVLDLGCGCGIPVARSLANAGHAVTGVDFSHVQLERARRLVPTARFLQADATRVTFPASTFDAVVCLYMLFHLPLDDQRSPATTPSVIPSSRASIDSAKNGYKDCSGRSGLPPGEVGGEQQDPAGQALQQGGPGVVWSLSRLISSSMRRSGAMPGEPRRRQRRVQQPRDHQHDRDQHDHDTRRSEDPAVQGPFDAAMAQGMSASVRVGQRSQCSARWPGATNA